MSVQEVTHNDSAHMNTYLNSFVFPSTIKLCNILPESVVQARDVEEFQ